jgi:hypothetical protein
MCGAAVAMTRSSKPLLSEEDERIEEAKLQALKQAANEGWADVSGGRYTDIDDDQLAAFVGQLGRTDIAIER